MREIATQGWREQLGVFSPTGPKTALIDSGLAEICRVIGTVDVVLMPKTPPIMDLCRSYPLCGHEAYSLALSLEETFRGVPLQMEEKKELRVVVARPTTRVLCCSPELPRRCS
jgi:hypothetical protein